MASPITGKPQTVGHHLITKTMVMVMVMMVMMMMGMVMMMMVMMMMMRIIKNQELDRSTFLQKCAVQFIFIYIGW